jgi:hypothetical protein
MTVEYAVLEKHRADDLFRAPNASQKWAPLVTDLLTGNSVFVKDMTRIELESLRTVLRYRAPGMMLLSRQTENEGERGRLLRATPKSGK